MSSVEPLVDVHIVAKANDIDAVAGLIDHLHAGLDTLKLGGDAARLEMLITARNLMQALETPKETMLKHCWAQTGAISGLAFGVETGLWKVMAKDGGPSRKVQDLASETGVDPVLLGRFLRHLGAMGYIKETGLNEYQPTNFTRSMAIDLIGHGYIALPSCTGMGPLRFHEYSRKRGLKNPVDPKDTSMMYAYNTDKDMFAWQQSLGYGEHFNHHMGGYRLGRQPWMDINVFPVEDRLIRGAETAEDAPFLVDIGGSVGHDLVDFKAYYPTHPGQLILQDLPVVIGQIKDLDPSIKRMEYDFLTEQPIKGARAYYMHSTLHDWPDDVCEKILANIKAAMKPGYSKLLINENVIPDTDVWWEMSALDMVMLTLFCSRERSRADWVHLIEKRAGLKIIKIWGAGMGVESLIEIEIP